MPESLAERQDGQLGLACLIHNSLLENPRVSQVRRRPTEKTSEIHFSGDHLDGGIRRIKILMGQRSDRPGHAYQDNADQNSKGRMPQDILPFGSKLVEG